jgi:hypothetical protein
MDSLSQGEYPRKESCLAERPLVLAISPLLFSYYTLATCDLLSRHDFDKFS